MVKLIPDWFKIDVAYNRRKYLLSSVLLLVGTVVLWNTKGLNYGIDFEGGAEVQVSLPAGWDTGKLRGIIEAGGIQDPRVQRIGEPSSAEFLIRAQGDESSLSKISATIDSILKGAVTDGEYKILKSDVVGAAAGSTLRKKAFFAVFYALIAILLYVAIRFDARYAPGAVLALFHDSVITIGFLIIFGIQFDLTVLAAILALVGYSNNDTIIVYDRIRETLHLKPNLSIEDAVNTSVNETLNRTIITSLSAFMVSCSLMAFGGPVIFGFAATFTFGIIVGTYSSIFIASGVIVEITKYQLARGLIGGGGSGARTKKKKRVYEVRPDPSAGQQG